jgi:quinol monooxygenase YgiN
VNYAIIVKFRAKEGADDRLAETLGTVALATRNEPENLCFDVYRSVENPRDITLVERYTSPAGLDAHRATPHFAAAMAVLPDLIEERGLTEVSEVAPA